MHFSVFWILYFFFYNNVFGRHWKMWKQNSFLFFLYLYYSFPTSKPVGISRISGKYTILVPQTHFFMYMLAF